MLVEHMTTKRNQCYIDTTVHMLSHALVDIASKKWYRKSAKLNSDFDIDFSWTPVPE